MKEHEKAIEDAKKSKRKLLRRLAVTLGNRQ